MKPHFINKTVIITFLNSVIGKSYVSLSITNDRKTLLVSLKRHYCTYFSIHVVNVANT